MISRRSGRILAEAFSARFYGYHDGSYGSRTARVHSDLLYDFLYDHDYSSWFCNASKFPHTVRLLKEFFMQLHTGETQAKSTPKWSWEQRQQLGQKYLRDLAEDFLNWYEVSATAYEKKQVADAVLALLENLSLDGYVYRDHQLLTPEADVLDAREEAGVLEKLYGDLRLANKPTALHHLKLSEEHYLNGRWDDCIGNSRKFLEAVLREVAATHSSVVLTEDLALRTYEPPAAVRDYLEKKGLLEAKEKEAIAKVYGLLSNTGGHPYMAEKDQARLLRHLALTFSQFVMLRLQGAVSGSAAVT